MSKEFIIHTKKNGLLSLVLWAVMLPIHAVQAQHQVTFSLHTEHAHVGPGDQVVVRGSIPELGDWGNNLLVLSADASQPGLYSGTVRLPRTYQGRQILYKYVIIRSRGLDEWETRGNRKFTLNPGKTELPAVYFDDRTTPGTRQTLLQVTFQVDLGEFYLDGHPVEALALAGGRSPLSFEQAKRVELSPAGNGIWQTTVSFPYGTQKDVPFKFMYRHNGVWEWEWSPGYTTHALWLDDRSASQLVQLTYNPEAGRIEPVPGSSGHIDDYDFIMAQLGSQAATSPYGYNQAIELLKQNRFEQAGKVYQVYRQNRPGKEQVDDFHYTYAARLADAQGVEQAIAYINRQQPSEPYPERKAYYEYLKGELLVNANQPRQARAHFNTVLREFAGQGKAEDYSRQGLVSAWLQQDSTARAIEVMHTYLANDELSTPGQRRGLLRQLAGAYERTGQTREQEQTLRELSRTGTPAQQTQSLLRLAAHHHRQGDFTQALKLLDSIDASGLPAPSQVRHSLQRIEVLYAQGSKDELLQAIAGFEAAWPSSRYQPRLHQIKTHLASQTQEF